MGYIAPTGALLESLMHLFFIFCIDDAGHTPKMNTAIYEQEYMFVCFREGDERIFLGLTFLAINSHNIFLYIYACCKYILFTFLP